VFFFVHCKCDSAGIELNPEEVANELRKLGFKTQATSASERRQPTTTRPPKRAKGFTSRSGNPTLTDRLRRKGHHMYGMIIVRDRATKPGDVLFPGTEHPDMLYVTSPHEENPRLTKQWFLDRGESHFTTTFERACCWGQK
jgi:hypothetical protein